MPPKLPFEDSQAKVLVKYNCRTDPSLGTTPADRSIEQLLDFGIVNLDKPAGPTSRGSADRLGKILGVKKTGHSGTLDPAVTGVLPIALARATRIIQTVLTAGKEYICTMDIHAVIDQRAVEEVFERFTGSISQMPPVRSRVKRIDRQRSVYYMEILDIAGRNVRFRVGCQAGTYIRKLVHDMGQALGTGAHMAQLRRTKAGPFNQSNLCTLDELEKAWQKWKNQHDATDLRRFLLDPETAVGHLSKVHIDDSAVEPLSFGAALAVPGVCTCDDNIEPGQTVAVLTLKGELVALGIAELSSSQMIELDKGIAVRVKKVFMLNGTYKKD